MRLAEDEARRRLAAARVARLATVGGPGSPHLVPVTFAVAGDRIYSAVDAKPKTTRDLRRLRNIRADPRVAVLADHYDEDWSRLWWARADGQPPSWTPRAIWPARSRCWPSGTRSTGAGRRLAR